MKMIEVCQVNIQVNTSLLMQVSLICILLVYSNGHSLSETYVNI